MTEKVLNWLKGFTPFSGMVTEFVGVSPGCCGLFPQGEQVTDTYTDLLGSRTDTCRVTFHIRYRAIPGLGAVAVAEDFGNWLDTQSLGAQVSAQWKNAHLVSRDRVSVNSHCSDFSIDRVRELICADCVERQIEILAKACSLLDHFLAVVKLCLVAERLADLFALSLQECVSHAAADDQCVALLKQVGDDVQLISNLSAAEDRYERANRILNSIAEEVDFLLHQVSDYAGVNVLCDTNVGAVCAVSCSECVIYENISEGSKLLEKASPFFVSSLR